MTVHIQKGVDTSNVSGLSRYPSDMELGDTQEAHSLRARALTPAQPHSSGHRADNAPLQHCAKGTPGSPAVNLHREVRFLSSFATCGML